jgi:hypothetical protein
MSDDSFIPARSVYVVAEYYVRTRSWLDGPAIAGPFYTVEKAFKAKRKFMRDQYKQLRKQPQP